MALSPLKGRHKYLSGCTINGVSRATDAGAFCRRLGLYDFANSGHLAPHGSPLSGVKRTWLLRESAFAVAFGSKADMPYCGAHVCF